MIWKANQFFWLKIANDNRIHINEALATDLWNRLKQLQKSTKRNNKILGIWWPTLTLPASWHAQFVLLNSFKGPPLHTCSALQFICFMLLTSNFRYYFSLEVSETFHAFISWFFFLNDCRDLVYYFELMIVITVRACALFSFIRVSLKYSLFWEK